MISRCPSCGAPAPDEAKHCPACDWDFVNNKRGSKDLGSAKKSEPAELSMPPARQAPVGKSQIEPVSVGSLTLKGGGQVGVGATRSGPRIECDL